MWDTNGTMVNKLVAITVSFGVIFAILMPELTLQRAKVTPKQVHSQHYFAVVLSLHPELSSTLESCDWFKKCK